MDEARQVLERLARIEELEREHAPASELLAELRALMHVGEEWLRAESAPEAAVEALARCRAAMAAEGNEEVALLAQ